MHNLTIAKLPENSRARNEDGKWTEYWENGQIKSVENYKYGKKDGKWTRYYKNGQIASERNYKDDKGNIVTTLYSSYTMEKLKKIKSVEVDKIKVKGKEELVTIYKPL